MIIIEMMATTNSAPAAKIIISGITKTKMYWLSAPAYSSFPDQLVLRKYCPPVVGTHENVYLPSESKSAVPIENQMFLTMTYRVTVPTELEAETCQFTTNVVTSVTKFVGTISDIADSWRLPKLEETWPGAICS